jgi:hypothetical protein
MTRIIPESDSLFQREAFSQNLVRRLGIKAWESECSKKDVIFKAIICAVSITMHTAMNSIYRINAFFEVIHGGWIKALETHRGQLWRGQPIALAGGRPDRQCGIL